MVDGVAAAQLLEELLDDHPDAVVDAIDKRALVLPLPASVRLRGQRRRRRRPGPVRAGGVPVVLGLWEVVLRDGVAHGTVHYAEAPQVPVSTHLLDVRARHGVIMGVTYRCEAPSNVQDGRAPLCYAPGSAGCGATPWA